MSVEIKGLDEVLDKLARVGDFRQAEPAMRRSVERLRAGLARYPAARPTSRYRRTGTLGRRWTTEVDAGLNVLRGVAGNNTGYGPFVQDDERQAAMHQGRWQTATQVAQSEEAAIVQDFEQTIDALLK